MSQETVELDYDVLLVDDVHKDAVLFGFLEGKDKQTEIWIPRSQIEDIDTDNETVTVALWFAEENGLV